MTRAQGMLMLSVFAAGMTTLAVELSASRLLGNVFGTSNLVWANVIGLILVYLTAGYYLGGRLADRRPDPATFYRLLAWAAFSAGLIPLVAQPILRTAGRAFEAYDLGVLLGSFASVLILFALPVTLLGCVAPFAIRLALRDVKDAGRVAGRLYALSTFGSILGTFGPVLVLIPSIGTARTFLVFAGLLLAVALAGLALTAGRRAWSYAWMPLALILLAWLILRGPLKPPPQGTRLLYERESAYNYIQVVETADGTRYLLLNEGQGIHSVYHPDRLATFGTWDYFLAAPFFNAPPFGPERVRSLALIGLAAGTISKQYSAVFGPIPIDGIEIDPDIVAAGREYFAMNEPNLHVIVADGRYALEHSPRHYDVIGVDAYRLPYIPWHLTTREFFESVRAHLTSEGVVVINVGRTLDDRRLIAAMSTTLASVFPSVYAIDVPGTFNSILVATVRPSQAGNLAINLAALPADVHPLLRDVLARAQAALTPSTGLQPGWDGGVGGEDLIFTDDRAPVEQITNAMILRFILRGGFSAP